MEDRPTVSYGAATVNFMALARTHSVKALMAWYLTVSAAGGRRIGLRQPDREAALSTFRANSPGRMVAGFAVIPGAHVHRVISHCKYGVGLMVCRSAFALFL